VGWPTRTRYVYTGVRRPPRGRPGWKLGAPHAPAVYGDAALPPSPAPAPVPLRFRRCGALVRLDVLYILLPLDLLLAPSLARPQP
jgi:hypothetical protein